MSLIPNKGTIILVFLLIASPCFLSAEDFLIYNLKFPIIKINEIDSNLVEVHLKNNIEIVGKDDVNNFIVKNLFLNSNNFAKDDLKIFLEQSIRDENFNIAYLALKELDEVKNIKTEDYLLYEKLFNLKFYQEITPILIEELTNSQIKKSLVWQYYFYNGILNFGIKKIEFKEFLNQKIIEEINESIILSKIEDNISVDFALSEMDRFHTKLYKSSSSKGFEVFLKDYQDLISSPKKFIEKYDLFKLEYEPYYSRLNVQINSYQFDFIKLSLDNNFSQDAFDLLILTHFEERSEKHHEVLLSIINSISITQSPILIIQPYQSIIKEYSVKDARIKNATIGAYVKVINQFYSQNKVNEAQDYFNILEQYLEPSSLELNKLFFKKIQILHSQGLRHLVLADLETKSNFLNMQQRVWLFLRGYYLFLLITIGFLISLYFLIKYLKIKYGQEKLDSFDEPVQDTGNLSSKIKSLNSQIQEYKSLLSFFELKDTCVAKDIKKAYRKRVKEFHPDLNNGAEQKNLTIDPNNDFIEITKKYESLLALHNQYKKN